MRQLEQRPRPALGNEIPSLPKTRVAIRAVPDFLEASSPSASTARPRPNVTARLFGDQTLFGHEPHGRTSRWQTLSYHETLRGHHWESAVAAEAGTCRWPAR